MCQDTGSCGTEGTGLSSFLLTDLISSDILQEIQDAFSEYSGMAALITDANGTPVTKGSGFTRFCMEMTRKSRTGARKCEVCDRQGALMTMQSGKPAVYPCHAGLTDYAAPILLNGEFIGSFIGGQVRTDPVNEEHIREKAAEYHLDPDEYVAAAKMTNQIEREEIDKTANFLSRLAEVLSRVAYQRYLAMQMHHTVEETAKNQSDFMMRFSTELKQNVSELYSFFSDKKNKSPDNYQAQKTVYGLMARTLELGSIVEDTMDYTNIINGDFTLRETVYNIRSVIEMKLKEHMAQADTMHNEMSLEVSENVPEKLMGDPARIGSTIGKLIENSNRYTQESWIRVSIDVKKNSYATDLIIRVADGGVGIEPEQAQYIRSYMTSRGFSEVRDEEFEMLGFSLIGYHVNAMSGRIELVSELGKGTEFIITIPQLAPEGGDA